MISPLSSHLNASVRINSKQYIVSYGMVRPQCTGGGAYNIMFSKASIDAVPFVFVQAD